MPILAWVSCLLPPSPRARHQRLQRKTRGNRDSLAGKNSLNLSLVDKLSNARKSSSCVGEGLLRCTQYDRSILKRVFLCISGALYKSSILGGFFVSGTIPLFYELTVESTYPVAEGITTGALTIINNSFTVIFLVILMIPGVGKNAFIILYTAVPPITLKFEKVTNVWMGPICIFQLNRF